MDWLHAMNRAVDYLEEHITEKLDMEKAAQMALSSPFHFQRMYHVITGVTVGEYVRRRRLTLAAQDLVAGEKVIDVACKYGYESPEAFSKAFGKMHGLSPTAAREPGARLKAYPKLSFHISLKGDKDMDYKIVEKEGFRVIGRQKKITMGNGDNFRQVPAFWEECMKDGTMQMLCGKAGPMGVLGICKDFEQLKEEFYYMIAVEAGQGDLAGGCILTEIPPASWAVFESVGALPEAIQDLTRRIFSEWFPATGYKHACAPELEVYPPGDASSPDYRCEVWIPVEK